MWRYDIILEPYDVTQITQDQMKKSAFQKSRFKFQVVECLSQTPQTTMQPQATSPSHTFTKQATVVLWKTRTVVFMMNC